MFEAGQCTLRNSMVTIVCMFQVVSISSQYKVATYVIKCMLRVRNIVSIAQILFSTFAELRKLWHG